MLVITKKRAKINHFYSLTLWLLLASIVSNFWLDLLVSVDPTESFLLELEILFWDLSIFLLAAEMIPLTISLALTSLADCCIFPESSSFCKLRNSNWWLSDSFSVNWTRDSLLVALAFCVTDPDSGPDSSSSRSSSSLKNQSGLLKTDSAKKGATTLRIYVCMYMRM